MMEEWYVDLPPGFRFHPTEEELICYYLRPKINGHDADYHLSRVISELDVYAHEPWDLPFKALLGEREWFFLCPKGPKCQERRRPDRVTEAGYWKAEGKGQWVSSGAKKIGTKKTLVFYVGLAPQGQRSKWVMHEYCATSKELDGTHRSQGAFAICHLLRARNENHEIEDDSSEEPNFDEVEDNDSSPFIYEPFTEVIHAPPVTVMLNTQAEDQPSTEMTGTIEERSPMNINANINQEVEGYKDLVAPTISMEIKEKIAYVLQQLQFPPHGLDVLVQFWAPVMAEGRLFLTTLDQPFCLSNSNEVLHAFRNLCINYGFYVYMESEKELSIISRVFMQKSPKLILDVQSCSSEEYLQLDHFLRCNARAYVALPVIEPTNVSCVGVIELVSARDLKELADYMGLILEVCNQLKAVDLNYQSLNVDSGRELEEELKIQVIRSFMEKNIDSLHIDMESPPRTNGAMVPMDLSFQQLVVEDDATTSENDVITVDKSHIIPTSEKGNTRISGRQHRSTETSVMYKVLETRFGMKLKDAAEQIGVSRSTLKRLCRQHGISRWPSHRRPIVNRPLSAEEPSSYEPSAQVKTPVALMKLRNVKATYKDDIIMFQLSFSSRMADLEEEVAKRLKLKTGSFRMKYMDKDNDWILIACDADFTNCMRSSSSIGATSIRMLVQPISN